MRYRSLGCMVTAIWLGVWPLAAQADNLSNARAALKKGDLRTAQIELRNAVRNDPQNAEAHYILGSVSFELGDAVAAEREAIAARDRGHDVHQAVALLAQALLAQEKFDDLLTRLQPSGKDPVLDASILVSRGFAQLGLKRLADAKQSFADAERTAPDAVEPLLAEARLAEASGQLDDAQAKIDHAVAVQPKSAPALLAKAQLLRLRNDPTAALTLLDAVINDQPGLMQAYLDRASLRLAAGNAAAARTDVNVVLKAMPGKIQAIYMAAVIDAQARDYKAADAGLERISPYIGRIPRAYYLQAIVKEQLGQYEQAEDAARKFLGRTPDDLIARKTLARIQFAKHHLDQVVDTLANNAASGAQDAQIYDLLGRAYAGLGKRQDAVAAFQKAQALAPTDVGVQTRLASARMSIGDADHAVDDLEHALQLAPTLPAVSEALFFAALGTGDLQKTQHALSLIHSAQGNTEVVANLDGLFKLAQIDLDGAKAAFETVVQDHPDFVPGRINLARVDSMMGDAAAAEKQLTEVLSKQPASIQALTLLVGMYGRQQRQADTLQLLERAHAANPAATTITLSLGEMYIRSGVPRRALELATSDQKLPVLDRLGLQAAAQLALGNKAEARATYDQVLKQDPGSQTARRQLVALLVDAGDVESARNLLTAGIALQPHDYQLYLQYALVDLKAAGLDAALATARRLGLETQDFAPATALTGDIYLAVNKLPEAVTAFRNALRDRPDGFLLNRTVNAMLRAGQPDQARMVLTEWLRQHPADLAATQQLSEIDLVTNQLDEASQRLNTVLQQQPHNPAALNNLAWIDQQQGKGDAARALAHQAYMLAPGTQTADTLGWILTSSGDAKTGVALLRQAQMEGASDPRIRYHYAVALKATGQREEAKREAEAAVAVRGDYKEKAEAQRLLDDLARGS